MNRRSNSKEKTVSFRSEMPPNALLNIFQRAWRYWLNNRRRSPIRSRGKEQNASRFAPRRASRTICIARHITSVLNCSDWMPENRSSASRLHASDKNHYDDFGFGSDDVILRLDDRSSTAAERNPFNLRSDSARTRTSETRAAIF